MSSQLPNTIIKKIVTQGRGRILSVTRIFPDDWQYVQIDIIGVSKDAITIRFSKVK